MTLVSVLLPVHNGARYLESATRSILNQTHRDLEVIIVDDGSTDGSGEIVTALGDSRVRVIRNERNLGLPASLNRGLREARAEIIARQDADDLSHPQRIEAQVRFLEANPKVALVGTQAWVIDEQGRCLGSAEHAREHESLVWELMFDNAFIHTSVAFHRSLVLDAHGGYNEAWAYNQDYELWTRLAQSSRLANLSEPLVASRAHGTSMTQTMAGESARANRRILARNLPLMFGEVSADTIELVACAREGMNVRDLRRLLPLLKRWQVSYRASIGQPSMDDFRATVARQYLNLALTRRRRTLERVFLALWGGRHEARDLSRILVRLLVQKGRLKLGHDPLRSYGVVTH